jgi:hypothetical protein
VEKPFIWPTSDLLKYKWIQHNKGVEAVRQYYGFLEGGPLQGQLKWPVLLDNNDSEILPPTHKMKQEERSSISVCVGRTRVTTRVAFVNVKCIQIGDV